MTLAIQEGLASPKINKLRSGTLPYLPSKGLGEASCYWYPLSLVQGDGSHHVIGAFGALLLAILLLLELHKSASNIGEIVRALIHSMLPTSPGNIT